MTALVVNTIRVPGAVRPLRRTDDAMQPMAVEAAEIRHDVDKSMRFEIARMVEYLGVDVLFIRHRLEIDHGQIAA